MTVQSLDPSPAGARSLGVQPWMTAPSTCAVIEALEARGGRGCARFVGGCVRDALVGLPVDDIDIATTLTPDEATAALEAAGLRVIPTGVEHGTVTAISDRRPYEVTTLRRDVSTDGRRAVVAFTTDWSEDARRRDFRLNALYADPDGRIFDPTGLGVDDAMAGRIVFVGDPMIRIREDYLRILRFFRFYAWFGRGEPDTAAVGACRALKGMLAGRSAERTQKEVLKLLAAPDPRLSLKLMEATGVLAALLPFVKDLQRLDGLVEIEKAVLNDIDPELRLAALVPPDRAMAEEAAERLRLSNAQKDRLVAAEGSEPRITAWMSARQVRRAVWRLGGETFCDRAKLKWAEAAASPRKTRLWRGLIAAADSWQRPEFPVSGEDAMAAGAKEGPMVGQILREIEDWWIDEDFPSDRALALERLKTVVEGMQA
jgi:poly(A) polymerase